MPPVYLLASCHWDFSGLSLSEPRRITRREKPFSQTEMIRIFFLVLMELIFSFLFSQHRQRHLFSGNICHLSAVTSRPELHQFKAVSKPGHPSSSFSLLWALEPSIFKVSEISGHRCPGLCYLPRTQTRHFLIFGAEKVTNQVLIQAVR